MPICRVAPSPTRLATSSPIARLSASGGERVVGGQRLGHLDGDVDRLDRHLGVAVGVRHLVVDHGDDPAGALRHPSMAAGRTLTSMPRDSWPSRGGAQWTMTTSGGMRRCSSTGTSESRLGT